MKTRNVHLYILHVYNNIYNAEIIPFKKKLLMNTQLYGETDNTYVDIGYYLDNV